MDRYCQVEGGEHASACRTHLPTMPGGQSPDAVPAVPPSRRVPAMFRRHQRLHKMWTENPRHRSHISALINIREIVRYAEEDD